MKYIILFLFIVSSSVFSLKAQTDSLQVEKPQGQTSEVTLVSEEQRAEEAYNDGRFDKSIELYEQLVANHLAKGEVSADLYYNLGNAYFRDGEIAKAILNYERALLLNPGDKDIRHNIKFANTRIEDKIDTSGSFFLNKWIHSFQEVMSSNGWAWFAVVSFILLIVCVFVFFFSKTVLPKQITFYAGILLVILVILGNVFAFRQRSDILQRESAIIMSPSVIVRSSPTVNGKEVFNLHAGTKVKITKEDRDWSEIETADGRVGWIENKRIEKIYTGVASFSGTQIKD